MKILSLFKTLFALGILSLALVGLAETTASVDTDTWKLPPEPMTLKDGPGADLMKANCLLCHSTEYISTQPLLKRSQWEAEVTKMRAKFGAPISTNSVPGLVDYLVKNYGTTNR